MSIDQDPATAQPSLVETVLQERFEPVAQQQTISDVARFLQGEIDGLPTEQMRVIPIVGGPASGKSTLTGLLKDKMRAQGLKTDSICVDGYNLGTRDWRWQHERDDPLALKDFDLMNRHIAQIAAINNDTDTVATPVYDELTGLALEVGAEHFPHKIGRTDVLFVEGDFDPVTNPDLLIFVDVPAEMRLQARIDRDLARRGVSDPEVVAKSFWSRQEKQYYPITEPAVRRAGIILCGTPAEGEWLYDVYKRKRSNQVL